MTWPDDEPFELEPDAAYVEPQRGGMLLVALGLVGGSLITAAVFWVSGFESPRPRGVIDRPEVSAVAARPTPPHVPAGTKAAPVIADASPVSRDATPDPSGTEAVAAEPPSAIAPERVAHSEEEAVSADQRGTAASEAPAPRPATAHDVGKASTRLARAEIRASAAAEASACRRASTPADRLVCNDLGLEMLDLRLQEAYARALNARADPVILGAGQTAWRRARDEVSDPQRLARLYDQRIRELNEAAATAQAVEP